MSDVTERLAQWCEAYPEEAFPPTTYVERQLLHQSHPGLQDRIAADMARHMIEKGFRPAIKAIAQARAVGWREGVEAAAKVARSRAARWRGGDGECSLPLEEECEDIAIAIRALTIPTDEERGASLRIPSDAPYIKPDVPVSGMEDL